MEKVSQFIFTEELLGEVLDVALGNGRITFDLDLASFGLYADFSCYQIIELAIHFDS